MDNVKYTKEEFAEFCKEVQKYSEYRYEEEQMLKTEEGYQYNAEFRCPDNYRIPFKIKFDGERITWDEPEFYSDELEDTKPFFEDVMEEISTSFISKKQN